MSRDPKEISVKVGMELEGDSTRKVTIETVSYSCPASSNGHEEIRMTTTDGKKCDWFVNYYCRLRYRLFRQVVEAIQSGTIKEGTEVTVIENKNGILAFGLEIPDEDIDL